MAQMSKKCDTSLNVFVCDYTHSEASPPVSTGSSVINVDWRNWGAAGLRVASPGGGGGEPRAAPGAQPDAQEPICAPSNRRSPWQPKPNPFRGGHRGQ